MCVYVRIHVCIHSCLSVSRIYRQEFYGSNVVPTLTTSARWFLFTATVTDSCPAAGRWLSNHELFLVHGVSKSLADLVRTETVQRMAIGNMIPVGLAHHVLAPMIELWCAYASRHEVSLPPPAKRRTLRHYF